MSVNIVPSTCLSRYKPPWSSSPAVDDSSCATWGRSATSSKQSWAASALLQILEFTTKKDMSLDMWTSRQQKIESFFGPGVTAKINSTEQVSARTANCLSATSCSPGCTHLLLLTDGSSEHAASRGWSQHDQATLNSGCWVLTSDSRRCSLDTMSMTD